VGVSLFYESLSFFLVAALFMLALHAFVVLYEEPTLRRTFGTEYASYCATVNRWLPGRPVT
jgi:protein-S-isoprenylcysteine O-methyltransferase Ste14